MTPNSNLLYTLFCDDVRLEAGNKLVVHGSLSEHHGAAGTRVADQICGGQSLAWRGDPPVRSPDPDARQQHPIVVSQPTSFEITPGGYADNISFFVNVTFPAAGQYWVQTLVNSSLFDEQQLTVSDGREALADNASQAVN